MEKIIQLGKGYGKYKEEGRLILLDEPLFIKLENAIEGVSLFFMADNGKEQITGEVKDNIIELKRRFLKIGKLKLKILGMVGENQVCEYLIEDLLISEIAGKMEAIPQVELLLNKFNEYTIKVEKFMQEVEKLMKIAKVLCDIDVKIGGNND